MKLRPTKTDRTILNKLKKITDESTYTKAVMIAAESYPKHLQKISDLEERNEELNNSLAKLMMTWQDHRSAARSLDELCEISELI